MRKILSVAVLVLLTFAPLAARATEVQKVVSPGGIEAWLVEDHLNPIITMNFAFRGGSALDPKGKEGLANMAASLLDEGAGDLDSKTFQQTLEDLSITLRFNDSRDSFTGRLQTLTRNRDRAFELERLALTQPRFDAEPVDRLRGQLLAGLRQDQEDPDAVAGKKLMATLYPDHPYGRPSDGTVESVSKLTVADLKKFVADRLARGSLYIAVVGDITAKELAPLLDKTFGDLPKTATPWNLNPVDPAHEGRTIVVQKAIAQSNILWAERGIPRKDKDFYAAYVLNHILGGGGFTSRLYTEVREKRGLAYSVFTYLNPLDATSLIVGGAGTANARAAETIKIVRQEWQKMAEHGVTSKELENAKKFLTGSFPLRFTSSERTADMLLGMQMENLGIDYLDKRNKLIEAVSLKDIQRVAKRLLRPENLVFVVVGQPAGVAATQ